MTCPGAAAAGGEVEQQLDRASPQPASSKDLVELLYFRSSGGALARPPEPPPAPGLKGCLGGTFRALNIVI